MKEEFVPTPRSTEGQARFEKKLEEIAKKSPEEAREEASAAVEDSLRLLNEFWAERGFTPEQIIWCIALVTINMRESFPDKPKFDQVCREATEYYRKNAE